jgi:hypothetical protein
VLLTGKSFPLSPRVFTSFTVFWRNGGTRPVRPVVLTCIPSFLVRHHDSPPFLRTILKSGKNTFLQKATQDFLQKATQEIFSWKKKSFPKKKSLTVLAANKPKFYCFHRSQENETEEVTNCGTRTPLMNVHSSVTGNVARKSDNLSCSSLSAKTSDVRGSSVIRSLCASVQNSATSLVFDGGGQEKEVFGRTSHQPQLQRLPEKQQTATSAERYTMSCLQWFPGDTRRVLAFRCSRDITQCVLCCCVVM